VPEHTSEQLEDWWEIARHLHPGWTFETYRDPIDPDLFPETSPHWERCDSGAQLAGLIRLEALWCHGGIYLDSDVECFRTFEPLRDLPAFAAWEDPGVVPDAILGAEPQHPAIRACLDLALARIDQIEGDWRTGPGAWSTGPGVTTTVLPDRDDTVLFPPGTFYEIHYSERHRLHETPRPWELARHHWQASWLDEGAA